MSGKQACSGCKCRETGNKSQNLKQRQGPKTGKDQKKKPCGETELLKAMAMAKAKVKKKNKQKTVAWH